VTFLFTDIEGSTRRWDLEPETMRGSLVRHDGIVRIAIEENGGYVFATGGDGFAAAFARADEAVHCAVAIQATLQATDLPAVRMGVHTGEADERDGDYFGAAVNRAARLMAIAHGGQIVVSRATQQIVTGVDLVDLGEHRLRDLSRPEHVFQVAASGLRSDFPPLRSSAADAASSEPRRVEGAPEPFTSFVGRADELARVVDALVTHRLVTLTGPGGMGKTRLAIETAQSRLQARAWFVDLVPADAESLIGALAAALHVAERPNESMESVVQAKLGEEPTLLILDNCEHLLDAVAAFVERALRACATLGVLATSREPLALPGEHVVPVGPLDIETSDGAVALFEQRASDAGASLEETDADAIIEIVSRLDGIPLAIELAAARVATLGVDGLRQALGDRLRLLSGARRADSRHRSLRDVLDWSYDLLENDARTALRRVSVFHGSFSALNAAAVHGADDVTVPDTLARLAAKNLVALTSTVRAPRYRLLETVREYAWERLVESGEDATVLRAHAHWASDVARDLVTALERDDVVDPIFEVVVDDVRAATAWSAANGERAWAHAMSRALGRLAYARRFMTDAQTHYDEAARLAADDVEASRDLFDAANCAFGMMRGEVGFERLVVAGELAERGADRRAAALYRALAAERVNRFPGSFAAIPERAVVDSLFASARDLAPPDDPVVAAQLAISSAWVSARAADTPTSETAELALELARAANDPLLESSALDALAAAYQTTGRAAESVALTASRMELLDRMRPHDPSARSEQMDILHMAVDSQASSGNLPLAVSYARRAVAHPLGEGAMHVMTRGLVIGLVLTGQFEEALENAAVMRDVWERAGKPSATWMAPAAFLVTLMHGLRGERADHDDWLALSEQVLIVPRHPMRSYYEIRLAMHAGTREDLAAAVARHDARTGDEDDSGLSWSGREYEAYASAIAAEALAMLGEAEAVARVAEVRDRFPEHYWVGACLLRAAARLGGDGSTAQAAVEAFAALEARFEVAVTQLLVGGADAQRGREELIALGCERPEREPG
jgi:predicted ATPase